jgi:hypothetical protein
MPGEKKEEQCSHEEQNPPADQEPCELTVRGHQGQFYRADFVQFGSN